MERVVGMLQPYLRTHSCARVPGAQGSIEEKDANCATPSIWAIDPISFSIVSVLVPFVIVPRVGKSSRTYGGTLLNLSLCHFC